MANAIQQTLQLFWILNSRLRGPSLVFCLLYHVNLSELFLFDPEALKTTRIFRNLFCLCSLSIPNGASL